MIKHSITVSLMPVERADHRHNIWIRVSFLCKRYTYYLPFLIPASAWDKNRQRVKPNYIDGITSGTAINKHIRETISTIEEYFEQCDSDDAVPTTQRLKELVSEKEQIVRRLDLTPFQMVFDEFITSQSILNSWSEDTIGKLRNIESRLLEFKPNITMQDFTEKNLALFLKFLEEKHHLLNNSIAKRWGYLKWFLKWAYRHKYLTTTEHEAFTPRFKGVSRAPKADIYLDWDELMAIHDLDLGTNHRGLTACRDVFLFQCFTGLRYSDVRELKKANIHDDCIHLTTKKTADTISINLNDWSREVLQKYKDIPINGRGKDKTSDYALPVISNQKMNDEIKEICRLAGIDKPIQTTQYSGNTRIDEVRPKYQLISSHAGRRTFVIHAIRLGIPIPVVMKYTGHSSYNAMLPYVNVVDSSKKVEMEKFNKQEKPKE